MDDVSPFFHPRKREIDEVMAFFQFGLKEELTFEGTMRFNFIDAKAKAKKEPLIYVVSITKDRNIFIESNANCVDRKALEKSPLRKALPEKYSGEVTISIDDFLYMYSGKANAKDIAKMCYSGRIKVHNFSYRNVSRFAQCFDFTTEKWNDFYKVRAEKTKLSEAVKEEARKDWMVPQKVSWVPLYVPFKDGRIYAKYLMRSAAIPVIKIDLNLKPLYKLVSNTAQITPILIGTERNDRSLRIHEDKADKGFTRKRYINPLVSAFTIPTGETCLQAISIDLLHSVLHNEGTLDQIITPLSSPTRHSHRHPHLLRTYAKPRELSLQRFEKSRQHKRRRADPFTAPSKTIDIALERLEEEFKKHELLEKTRPKSHYLPPHYLALREIRLQAKKVLQKINEKALKKQKNKDIYKAPPSRNMVELLALMEEASTPQIAVRKRDTSHAVRTQLEHNLKLAARRIEERWKSIKSV